MIEIKGAKVRTRVVYKVMTCIADYRGEYCDWTDRGTYTDYRSATCGYRCWAMNIESGWEMEYGAVGTTSGRSVVIKACVEYAVGDGDWEQDPDGYSIMAIESYDYDDHVRGAR